MELRKGQTIMVDADLQQPSRTLHKDVCSRSRLPADNFELYHGSKRLEDEAPLASCGVKKNSLIEVKMRGRGGMQTAGGEGSGVAGLDVAGGSGGGESVEEEEAQTEGAADNDVEIGRMASTIHSDMTSAPEPTKGPDPEAAPRPRYDIGVSAQALWEYLCSLFRRAVRSGQLVGGE